MTTPTAAVRCPRCGSTDAGETEALYDLTRMTCQTCGFSEIVDHYQIKDDWNVPYVVDDTGALPARLPPLLLHPCATCRSKPSDVAFLREGEGYVLLEGARDVLTCPRCNLCFAFMRAPEGMQLRKLHPSTSAAIRAAAAGTLTQRWLDALRAVEGFEARRFEGARIIA